jgi:hypothetical protein
VKLLPCDVPEFAIADATAATLSPLLPRAAKVDISRVSFLQLQCGHCALSSPGRTNASKERSQLAHRYS